MPIGPSENGKKCQYFETYTGAASKVLYEVTASGVYADWPGPVGNGNRLRWQVKV